MIEAATRGAWHDLEANLRPFIARRVATATDVDDVMQEVFVRLQRGLAGLRDDDRFGPWVYQVARNAIADFYRAAAKHPVADGPGPELASDAPDDDDSAARAVASFIAPFVAMLPSPYREALTLTELEGLTQKQAAEMTGILLSGMKSRVQRGRGLLRTALEDCCHIAVDARGHVVDYQLRADARLPDDCCR